MTGAVLDWMVQDSQRLAECRHDHPFSLLGPQQLESGQWIVRAWVPEAETVELILNGERLSMQTPHHPWVFEAECSRDPGHNYKLQIRRGGIEHEQFDPWAFRHE